MGQLKIRFSEQIDTPATATIADTGMPSEPIAPVMKKQITARQKENLKKKVITEKKKLEMEKIKTKLSLSLKKSTKLNAHIHLIPADFVVKLVVDFLYDHNLCHCNHCSHPIDQRSTIIRP